MTTIIVEKMPDIKNYMSYIYSLQLSSDVSVVVIFKQLFRDDDILVDIYLNEISSNTKIVSGRKLTANSLICKQRHNLGFEYEIFCVDCDGIDTDIKKNNVKDFYLQFVKDGNEGLY